MAPTNGADGLSLGPTGWTYLRTDDDTRWQFDAAGKLLARTERNGWTSSYAYSTSATPRNIAPVPDLLIRVSNHFGRAIHLEYNASRQLARAVLPDGQVVGYLHDTTTSLARLTGVTLPASTSGVVTRTYLYESTVHPQLLTGVVDEGGERLRAYTYDPTGRATRTESALGADRNDVTYGSGWATVVDPLGMQRTFNYGTPAGKLVVTGASATPAGDGSSAATRVQDASGLMTQETDFLGVSKLYTWDPSRRLPLTVTEASGRPESRATTIQWHPTFALPTQASQPGKTLTYSYDGAGNRTGKTELDTVTGQARTWAWTYNTQGLLETSTEPHGAVTAYEYTAGGHPSRITDPLGRQTVFEHDAAGRISRVTEPNGTVRTYTYDQRGRVLTQSVGGLLTTFSYRSTGQLASSAHPSGLVLAYLYDAAQRLVGWSSNRGAQATFTLDAMGNRTSEQLRDSAGNLVWQLARTVNSANRVIAETLGTSQSTSYGYNANGDLVSEANASARDRATAWTA